MEQVHQVKMIPKEPSKVNQKIQQDLRAVISKQTLERQQNDELLVRQGLRAAANKMHIQQALLRLIVHHDLPLSIVE
jgi:virulence-associated protein VapD